MQRYLRWSFVLAILAAMLGVSAVQGQSNAETWTQPVNLSRSGAAAAPRIVAGPDGRLRVFWWDRFDGLTMARFDGQAWSAPVAAPIRVGVDKAGDEWLPRYLSAMPTIVGDARGGAHAFWLGEPDKKTGARPLMHDRMPAGSVSWVSPITPTVVVESAVAFDVAATPTGELTLAYVRTLHNRDLPAGVYVKRTVEGGAGWRSSVAVYQSIYFRLLTAETAHVRVADAGDGTIHLAWDDPHRGLALYARSADGGFTWSAPEALGDPTQRPARPRVFARPDGNALRLWEAAGMGGCALYQQRLVAGPAETPAPTPVATGTLTATLAVTMTPPPTRTPAAPTTRAWSAPGRVLEGVNPCPQEERTWSHDNGLLWLWGEGTGALTLAAWDAGNARWSVPHSLSFRFQDPDTARWVGLGDLHTALAGDALAVVGLDPTTNEVWVTVGQVKALDLAFAPPPPWSGPVRLSQTGQEAGEPAVAMDAAGGVHVAWSQGAGGGPGASLYYARFDSATGRWTRAVEVARGTSGEMARQPALLADGRGLLHLVWSGGAQGQIMHSRARLGEAASAGGWSPTQPLSAADAAASEPQIGLDAAGRLYVVYVVPLNEGRGVYLVRSEDGGETWSRPELVFDAVAEGQAMVDHPTLAVAPDGTRHVAWVQKALPDTWPPQGIVYTRQEPGASAWAEPLAVAGVGYDWPRLALVEGAVHLLYGEASGGSVWHRWSASAGEAGGGWSTPARVPGWQGTVGPYGLAVSGPGVDASAPGVLHLVGVSADGEAVLYSTWAGTRWSAVERYSLGPEVEADRGAAAATRPQGGRLAVAVRAQAAGNEAGTGEEAAAFAIVRTIPTVDVPALPTPAPTPTPLVTPSPTPTPTAAPSATPDLTSGPLPSDSGYLPLILGGGLAAVVVVGVLVARGMWGRRE